MSVERPSVVRILLVVLAVPNLVAGGWALVAPRSWYDDFPGWAPHLVSALPPYNEHLATDAGAGLFATGLAAAVAAWWMRRDLVLMAAAIYLAFALPHAAFHVTHPAESLSRIEDAVNAGSLVVAAVAAAIVLLLSAGLADRRSARTLTATER